VLKAITREVSSGFNRCELSYLNREVIDIDLAREQHSMYLECLSGLGCDVTCLPQEPNLPDSVFVEDTAVVLKDLAIITRPGVSSRRPEVLSITRTLEPYRDLAFIESPGTVDGGDVLLVGNTLYVGLTQRSNREGFEQLLSTLSPHGYDLFAVEVDGCLHLKSAVTRVAVNTLLVNRNWVNTDIFHDMSFIDVDPGEPYAANALLVGGNVILSSAFPRTSSLLEEEGIEVLTLDVSELARAEGGVTCCSLIFDV
jgi:dimethylargininase